MGEAINVSTEELCKENEDARLLLDGNLLFDGNPNAMIKGLKFHAHASFDFHESRKVESENVLTKNFF